MLRTEQRSEPRITTRIIIESVGPTLNLSAGGMCVLIGREISANTDVSLQFQLPEDKSAINCKGRVVWVRRSQIDADLFEMGICFTNISETDRRKIDTFVDAHLSEQK